MEKEIIFTETAPPPRPGRAQAVRYGDLLFLSGQVSRDPQDRRVGGDIQIQTRRVIENLKLVLEAGGSSLTSVLKMNIFLRRASDYDAVNEVYYEYFLTNPVARTCVQAGALAGPGDIQIEVIAAVEKKGS